MPSIRSNETVATLRHNPWVVAALSGLVGGVAGAIPFTFLVQNWDWINTANSAHGYFLNAIYFIFFGATLALVIASWNTWTSGSRRISPEAIRAMVFTAIGIFIAAVIGNYIYNKILGSHSPGTALDYLARIVGWAVVGAGIGASYAASYGMRSKRVLNGLIGGAIGGAVAGLVSELIGYVFWSSEPGWVFTALLVIPIGIGVALGTTIVERVLRESWVKITAGPMGGKEFTLYKPETRVGSDFRCDIVMARDPGVRPFHLAFLRDGTGSVTVAPFEGAPLNINGTPSQGGPLRNDDAVVIGASVLTYQDKAPAR